MPQYEYRCERCKGIKELIRPYDAEVLCCDTPMSKGPGSFAMIKIDGFGFPSRRKWMDNFNPDHPTEFSTGSLHGAKY